MLETKWAEGKFVCVGLDPDLDKLPTHLKQRINPTGIYYFVVDAFCHAIIGATYDVVCAFKPNSAFFESLEDGDELLAKAISVIHAMAPDVPVILDAKRGDIGNTNAGYVRAAFDRLGADAITIHPYLGQEANQPFLDRKDKGIFALCRTSNKGSAEFQNHGEGPMLGPLYEKVAHNVSRRWNTNGNCGLVVGATYPQELSDIRRIAGDMPFLIPGIGAQGGDVEKTILAGKDSRGKGMIINSSRGILYASSGEDFAEAARRETLKLHEEIKKHLSTSNPEIP